MKRKVARRSLMVLAARKPSQTVSTTEEPLFHAPSWWGPAHWLGGIGIGALGLHDDGRGLARANSRSGSMSLFSTTRVCSSTICVVRLAKVRLSLLVLSRRQHGRRRT